MMKTKKKKQPKKTPDQIQREAEEKERQKKEEALNACRKKGKAVRFTFLCAIKKVTGCDDKAAIAHFEAAVKDGRIKQAGTNTAGDVGIFEA